MNAADKKQPENGSENESVDLVDETTVADSHSQQQPDEPTEPLSLEEQLKVALAQRDANDDHWKRAQADLENYRRRAQKEIQQERQYGAMSLVRDLLPGFDNLQRAIEAAKTSQNLEELTQGVEMVCKQLADALATHSLVPIESVGQPFDPNLHEAIQHIPSTEHPEMTVMQEVERGFKLHDRVVRPSKVIVSSGPPQQQPSE